MQLTSCQRFSMMVNTIYSILAIFILKNVSKSIDTHLPTGDMSYPQSLFF